MNIGNIFEMKEELKFESVAKVLFLNSEDITNIEKVYIYINETINLKKK